MPPVTTDDMQTPFLIYTILWLTACLFAAILAIRNRGDMALFQPPYWTALLQRWKVSVFIVAAGGMTLIAPYTGDPTWDYVDTLFMSLLTYTTAPWSVGSIYRFLTRERHWPQLYIALCLMLFSASWSYDLYLFFRDGYYPLTWLPNIFASSFLYILAGMLWSLEWREERGVVMAFTEARWPQTEKEQPQLRPLLFALPLAILVMAFIAPFLIDYFRQH